MVNSRILKSINFIVDVVVVIVVVNEVVVALLIVTSHIIATLGLHLGFSARLRIWQVSAYKMEPRGGSIIIGPATQPPTQPSTELVICNLAPVQKVCEVSPPPIALAHCSKNMCGVPPSRYTLFLCGVIPQTKAYMASVLT